jgi:predicted RND superfamily exporter protein
MMRALGRFVARRPWLVIGLGLALTLLSLWPASRLRLATDLVSLLPDGSSAAADYSLFLEHFGGFEKVFVLVRAEDPESSEATAAVLGGIERLDEKLAELPLVAEVRTGLEDADVDFFLRFVAARAPLLLPDATLPEVAARLEPAAVAARGQEIAAAVRAPGGEARVPLLMHDPFGFAERLPALHAASGGIPIDLLTSTFLTEAGDVGLLILSPAVSEIDPESGRQLAAALDQAFAATKTEVLAESGEKLEILALGGPLYAAQDEKLFREDLEATLGVSSFACLAFLVLIFGSLRIPLASLLGLSIGMVWTAGLIGLTVGELTAVSLGFAAVLIGLGDYGIYLGARFHDRVLGGQAPALALEETFVEISAGLWSSTLTIALAFGALAAAHFRPLREVGLVVGLGMILMLAGSITVGAAFFVRRKPLRPSAGRWWRAMQRGVDALVDLAETRPKAVLGVSLLLAAISLTQIYSLELSADLRALRPADHPALAAEQLLTERFAVGIDTSTVVLQADSLDQLVEQVDAVKAVLEKAGGGRLSIVAPDWLVAAAHGRERLQQLAALRFGPAADELESSLRAANLDPRAFAPGLAALRAFAAGTDPGAPQVEQWPSGLRELIKFDGEKVWGALHLRIPRDLWPEGPPADLAEALRQAAPGSALASVVRIGAELKTLALRDIRNLMLIALLAVGLVVVLSFRGDLGKSAMAAIPVTVGSLWSLGVWGALDRPLDLLSLMAVPILFGIGIHDGLHSAHGVDERGIGKSVREAGAALFLTGGTTVLGFGSLVFSSIPGLQNSGILVAIGVSACWLATVLILPALDAWRRGRR